jgi:integral membrane protein
MWSTHLGRVRAIALIEGVSFLVLLFVAMPLKHLGGMPLPVKIVGWAHGALFLLVCGAVVQAMTAIDWPARRGVRVIVAALIPFGPFVIDKSLQREDEALQRATNS